MATRGSGRRYGAVLLACFGIGALFLLMTVLWDGPVDDEFLDSPLWPWGWLLLPSIAALAGLRNSHVAAATYGVALAAPQAVAIWLLGSVFYDESEGVSFWVIGLAFIVALAFAAAGAAAIASELAHESARRRLQREANR